MFVLFLGRSYSGYHWRRFEIREPHYQDGLCTRINYTHRERETNPLTRGGRQTDFNCFFGGVFTIERSMSAPPERFPSANGDWVCRSITWPMSRRYICLIYVYQGNNYFRTNYYWDFLSRILHQFNIILIKKKAFYIVCICRGRDNQIDFNANRIYADSLFASGAAVCRDRWTNPSCLVQTYHRNIM